MQLSKKYLFLMVWGLLTFVFLTPVWGTADEPERVYKVGYLVGGEYWAFNEIINAFKIALKEKGWQNRVVFPPDAQFSPGWGAREEHVQSARDLMARDDLDLIISMGTGITHIMLEANNQRTPVLAMGISDPIQSGFVKSLTDSGLDNFTVRIIPDRWRVMFELFFEVVEFRKLGLMYPNTEAGHLYSNVADARKVARDFGFQLVEHNISEEETIEDCRSGLEYLISQGADAFFIPALLCFDWERADVSQLFDFFFENNLPTFARDGSHSVRAGALMGLATMDYLPGARFEADMAIQIFQGKKPRDINMIYAAPPRIAINLETARRIGFHLPVDVLIASDEIYSRIRFPDNRLVK